MKRILIVEDEEFLIDAYLMKLKSDAFSVEIARDGEEAVAKIDASEYDLYILDLILPKKNGLEVLKHIRGKDGLKSKPVVIASNIDKRETLEEALKVGATDYFIKSEINLADLQKKIESHLG